MEMYYVIAAVVALVLIIGVGIYGIKRYQAAKAIRLSQQLAQAGDGTTPVVAGKKTSPYLAAREEQALASETGSTQAGKPGAADKTRDKTPLVSSVAAEQKLGEKEENQPGAASVQGETASAEEKASPATGESVPAEELFSIGETSQIEAEAPEELAGRMQRLRGRLSRSGGFGKMLLNVIGRGDLSIEDWEEIEDTLIMADLGIEATEELISYLKTQAKVLNTNDPAEIKAVLRTKLLEMIDPSLDRSLRVETAAGTGSAVAGAEPVAGESSQEKIPAVVLAVGVNGVGKTTTVGKLARILVAEKKQVVLGAADTFRAAAAEQLQTWGERVGVPVIKANKDGADPASVAYETVKVALENGQDVALIDTAGRLQNKTGLMDELGKVIRVIEKQAPLSETLLVLDATTGQNGMQQARVFAEVAKVTGIVLTKLDGTAKGGIVVNVQRELGVPVKLVGLGEGPDDLAPFDPENFVDALLTA